MNITCSRVMLKVTIYDTELDNLEPVLKDFNNQTVPIEEFFGQSYDTIVRACYG